VTDDLPRNAWTNAQSGRTNENVTEEGKKLRPNLVIDRLGFKTQSLKTKAKTRASLGLPV